MHPVAITGSDPRVIELLCEVYAAREGTTPWVIWDATGEEPSTALVAAASDKLLTYKAIAYVAECQILTLRRVMDRTNTDHAWTVDADLVTAKDLPWQLFEDAAPEDDVILGLGYSRFSRKALECISRDFGNGLEYSGLSVRTV